MRVLIGYIGVGVIITEKWGQIYFLMNMQLTPFENEIIESLIWQIKGYKEGFVSLRN